jgi:hypothetical protein
LDDERVFIALRIVVWILLISAGLAQAVFFFTIEGCCFAMVESPRVPATRTISEFDDCFVDA